MSEQKQSENERDYQNSNKNGQITTTYYLEKRRDINDNIIVIPLCNFYFKIEKIMKLDGIRLINGKILFPKTENDKTRNNEYYMFLKPSDYNSIEFSDMDSFILHDQKEFKKFMAKYPMLWYRQDKVPALLTEIVKDISNKNIKIIEKNQSWGWNTEFTAYLTDNYDFVLQGIKGGIDEDGNEYISYHKNSIGEFDLINQNEKYYEENGFDGKYEGSVKIYDPDWQSKIHIGFSNNYNTNLKETMKHIINDLHQMHPIMPRVLAHTYLAPLTSIIHKMGYFPIMFINGTTGFGKTRIAVLCASHFGKYDSDQDFISVIADTRPSIEAVTYFGKDVLNVLDNWKETTMTEYKINELTNILQNASDGHARGYKGGKGYYPRGILMVTGEEMTQDASTGRKGDVITMEEPINMNIKDKCYKMKNGYSNVMQSYITYLMKTYGDGIYQIFKDKFEKISDIQDPLLKLNLIGYELFLRFFHYHQIIELEEAKTMLDAHTETLKKADIEKAEATQSKTTGQKFIDAIRGGIISHAFAIKGDIEYDTKYKPPIGQVIKEGTEIVIYDTAYAEIITYKPNYYRLPADKDSVYNQLKKIDKENITMKAVWNKTNKKTDWMLTFKRDFLFPNSVVSTVSMNNIAKIIDITANRLGISSQPDMQQYIAFERELLKLSCPKSKTDEFRIQRELEPIITGYFAGKGWEVPSLQS